MKNTEVLIIGGGISGLSAAYQLYKKQVPFILLTSPQNHSTQVAAGLINPLVFKRLTKSWNVDIFLPYAQNFYTEIEQLSKKQFFSPIKYHKIIPNTEWLNTWEIKKHDALFKKYLGEIFTVSIHHNTYQVGEVKNAYLLDTIGFTQALSELLREYIIYEDFNYQQLEITSKFVCYQNIKAKKILFCEGYEMLNNPFFKHLPMIPTKGEIIKIKNTLPVTYNIHKDFFLLNYGKELLIGSTYHWNNTSLIPSDKGIKELVHKYRSFTQHDAEIVSIKTGIRPAMKDRRPVLGVHQKHKNIFIFNGLGTKGCMTAPLLSEKIIRHMMHNDTLPPEIDVKRFYS